jgi:high-affinity iron transporter
LALAAIYVAMNILSIRLPLGVFFTITAGLLYYLALAFAGKGVVELQNAKALPITPLEGWPSIDWLGLFPTLEGTVAQTLLIVPVLLGLLVLQLKKRTARGE